MFSLSSPQEVAACAEMVLSDASGEKYLLKPEREGGSGVNVYGIELRALMESVVASGGRDLSAYVLMTRVLPAATTNAVMFAPDRVQILPTLSEFGFYNTVVSDAAGGLVSNEQSGFLVRTKATTELQGGVAKGRAVIDSPMLV
jgi:hypothetical protein